MAHFLLSSVICDRITFYASQKSRRNASVARFVTRSDSVQCVWSNIETGALIQIDQSVRRLYFCFTAQFFLRVAS